MDVTDERPYVKVQSAYSHHKSSVWLPPGDELSSGLAVLFMPEESAFLSLSFCRTDPCGYYTEDMAEAQVDRRTLKYDFDRVSAHRWRTLSCRPRDALS
jgi:hypothetical protein